MRTPDSTGVDGAGRVGSSAHAPVPGGTFKNRLRAILRRQTTGLRGKVLTLITGIAGAQAVGIAASTVLTRLYTPTAWGVYGIFTAYVGIGSALATLRYEQGVVVVKSRSERHGLITLMLWVALASGILTFAVATVVHSAGLVTGTSDRVVHDYRLLLALALPMSGIQVAMRLLAVKEQAYRLLAILRMGQAFLLALLQVGLGILLSGADSGLVLGTVVTVLCSLAVMSVIAVRRGWVNFHQYAPGWARAWVAARRNPEYPLYVTPSSFLNALAPQVPVLLIGALLSPAAAGQFFLAQRIVKGPMTWVSTGVANANFEDVSELPKARLSRVYRRRTRHLATAGFLPFVVMAALAPWAFSIAFGADWREAGMVTRLLAPGLFLQWVYTPFSHFFVVLRKQAYHLGWAVVRIALVAGGVYWGIQIAGVRGAAVGFSAAVGISFIIQHALLLYLLRPDRATGADPAGT